MGGGLRSSTSEFLRIPVVSSTMTSVRSFDNIVWQMGPDVGESRYGLRLASMNFENEIWMIGGISQTTGDMTWGGFMKVLNASLAEWTDVWANDWYSGYDVIALPVPKKIFKR